MRRVVVAAGAAGSVVAGRLVEAGHDVVVVEAGPDVPSAAVTTPSFFDALAVPGATYPEPFLRGRGPGGSGLVNGMVATPGDLDQYRRWGWDDAAAALARVLVPLEVAHVGPVGEALLAAAPAAAERVTLTARRGRRVTAADAYLGGVDVRAGVGVARIELVGGRATGVRLEDGVVVGADAVALAAGAIGSPLLLAASGVDHPEVGRGLRNHPGLPVTLRLHPAALVDVHAGVMGARLQRDDLEVLALDHLGPAAPGHAMLLVVALAPTGSGRVDPGPVVHHVVSAGDRRRLDDGLELVQELVAHPAFADVVAGVEVGAAPAGIYHPTSTCRMGVVVDDDGLVAGTSNVHVVDASVFPDIPRADTYLPTLMLAERLAARLATRG